MPLGPLRFTPVLVLASGARLLAGNCWSLRAASRAVRLGTGYRKTRPTPMNVRHRPSKLADPATITGPSSVSMITAVVTLLRHAA